MTRSFNVRYVCPGCGRSVTAESGFGRWMRNHPALDSVEGIVRTDLDHIILRYKTSLDGRDFQLLMIVEVKEHGAEPDASQTDILSFLRQLIERKLTNRHGAPARECVALQSRMQSRRVKVRFYGVHLLQFENTSPDDSSWIKWDRKPIDPNLLVGVLALERDSFRPDRMLISYLRDRHRKNRNLILNLEAMPSNLWT